MKDVFHQTTSLAILSGTSFFNKKTILFQKKE